MNSDQMQQRKSIREQEDDIIYNYKNIFKSKAKS